MKNKYFIVDYGKDSSEDMLLMAEIVVGALKMTKDYHVVTYLTDQPNTLYVSEVTEDEFLEQFKKESDSV